MPITPAPAIPAAHPVTPARLVVPAGWTGRNAKSQVQPLTAVSPTAMAATGTSSWPWLVALVAVVAGAVLAVRGLRQRRSADN